MAPHDQYVVFVRTFVVIHHTSSLWQPTPLGEFGEQPPLMDLHLLNLLIEAVVSAERLRTDGFHNEKRNSELQVLQAAKKLKNWFPILQDQPCTSTSTRRSLKNRGFRRVSPMFGARSQPPVQRGSGLRSQPLGGWCFESKTW